MNWNKFSRTAKLGAYVPATSDQPENQPMGPVQGLLGQRAPGDKPWEQPVQAQPTQSPAPVASAISNRMKKYGFLRGRL